MYLVQVKQKVAAMDKCDDVIQRLDVELSSDVWQVQSDGATAVTRCYEHLVFTRFNDRKVLNTSVDPTNSYSCKN